MKNEEIKMKCWAGRYSCGHENGYVAAVNALTQTKVNTYRTSSIPMADFWRPENLPAIGRVLGRRLPSFDIAAAEKVFECPTSPVCDGKIVGDPSMTDLMLRDGCHQIAIEGKYTEYVWGPCETLNEWLHKKTDGCGGGQHRRRIAQAWLEMIERAGCTGLHSCGELFAECGEVGYQFLHRTASACNGAGVGGDRTPVLVYQLFYDRDKHSQIAARDVFKASLRRWARLLKLTNMRFLVLEVPVTNGGHVEARTGELDARLGRRRSGVFRLLPDERLYAFDFDGIAIDDVLRRRRGEMTLRDVRDAIAVGGTVTLLMRHAERPPLAANDPTFGASLSLTPRGWTTARQFGGMLADVVRPKSVSFYASETFRTLQTACAMAIGLEESGEVRAIGKKVGLAGCLGGESPFFGDLADRMALIAEGPEENHHERMNEYFRSGKMRGYRPLDLAADELESRLERLHGHGERLVVAVSHDINVAAFLAARGVVPSFGAKEWPGYLDGAVVIRMPDGSSEYGMLRWDERFEGVDLLPWAV